MFKIFFRVLLIFLLDLFIVFMFSIRNNQKPNEEVISFDNVEAIKPEYDSILIKRDNIAKRFIEPEYYNQKDNTWGKIKYNKYLFENTGCVPSCVAMISTSLLDKEIKPNEVADILYENDLLNNNYYGAGAPAIIYMADYYNLGVDHLDSLDEIVNALNEGKLVLAAVGHGYFCPEGYTHEIILYSLNEEGYVKVLDPLNSFNNREYKLEDIYNERSDNYLDCFYGEPFFAIYRDIKGKDILSR